MKYKVGDKPRVFGTDEYVEIVGIEEGVLADIYGTIISAYKVKGTDLLYDDVYDGTVSQL